MLFIIGKKSLTVKVTGNLSVSDRSFFHEKSGSLLVTGVLGSNSGGLTAANCLHIRML
jgi:hypothetical protein